MRFVVTADWRHAAHRGMRANKLIGFLIRRRQQSSRDLIEKIFGYVHSRAGHHNRTMHLRWKHAERRLINRYKRRI